MLNRYVRAGGCPILEMLKQKLRVKAGSLAGVFGEQSKLEGIVGDEVEELIAGKGGRVKIQS